MKPYQELTFVDDFMFCKVLLDNPDIAKALAELITGRKIDRIKAIKDQYSISGTYSGRGIRFDVYFSDNTGTKYDLEMQTTVHPCLPKRTRYYQSLADQESLKQGKKYTELPNLYIVFICLKDPFDSNLPKYTFENRCQENGQSLNDGSYKIFINAASEESKANPELQDLIHYLRSGIVSDGISKTLEDAVNIAKLDEKGERMYLNWKEKLDAANEEGFEKGLEKGREEGRAESAAEIERLKQESHAVQAEKDAEIDRLKKELEKFKR
jgi:predicted transposase/invertase (TIGR01784 family)